VPGAVDGVLLIDKPPGRTSHDVVNGVRRERGGRKAVKVGHAGTLDPFATGLLLVLLGRATRAQRFLMGLPKTYEVVARFGAVSTTGDPTARSPRPARRSPTRSSCRRARSPSDLLAHNAIKDRRATRARDWPARGGGRECPIAR
jgi:tRNA pseudouridine55 synthase